MYFKDELHEEQTAMILERFGIEDVFVNVEYGALAYLVGATYKAKDVMNCFGDNNTIDLDMLNNTITVFSSSERSMIFFALQCFNSSMSDIKLANVMRSLDSNNTKVVKQAIDIRY